MSLRNIPFILICAITGLLAGCGGPENAAINASGNAGNTNSGNVARTNSNNPVAVTTPTPDQITNNAPTLAPIYKAYCAAVVKKDDTAIRKFFTADTLQSFDEQMKEDGIKKISEFVDKVTNEVCEVSNERIKGDKAVAKVKTISYPNGYEVLFIKENGEWKMSNMDAKTAF